MNINVLQKYKTVFLDKGVECSPIGPADLGSIQTLKMVLDTFLPNTQQYKVRIKGKV